MTVTGDLKKDSACRLCGNSTVYIQNGNVLDIHITYFNCPNCGYVQTESPYWLDQAYAQSINTSDTGIMMRNLKNSRVVLATMNLLRRLDGTLVDYAGGYGIMVRLLRDYGINALWSDRFSKNLVARGFEYTNGKADLVTAFEAFEHFVDPAEELDKMLAISPTILLSTEIISDPAPKQDDWWYYGREHGQHIGFFRIRTLEKLAKDRGKFLISDGSSYHIISDRPINNTLWKLLIRTNFLFPVLLGYKLTSKTLSDHAQIAKQSK
jgi:hypothetical protein